MHAMGPWERFLGNALGSALAGAVGATGLWPAASALVTSGPAAALSIFSIFTASTIPAAFTLMLPVMLFAALGVAWLMYPWTKRLSKRIGSDKPDSILNTMAGPFSLATSFATGAVMFVGAFGPLGYAAILLAGIYSAAETGKFIGRHIGYRLDPH